MKTAAATLAILSLLVLGGVCSAPKPVFATAITNACISASDVKSQSEVGYFLQNICDECYDQGDCALRDVEVLFMNVGNFTVRIVGALVMLMYVIGGVFLLVSHGDQALVTKGKQFIKLSTLGLLIVMFGYAGVLTLKSAVITGGSAVYPLCDQSNDGTACAPASVCWNKGLCVPECVSKGGECFPSTATTEDKEDYVATTGACPGTDTCLKSKTATQNTETEKK